MMIDRYAMPTDGPVKKKGKIKLEDELKQKIYVDKKGIFMPIDNIRMMLIGNKMRQGAANILGSQIETKKGTAYKNFCNACVWVLGTEDPLKVYVKPDRKTYDTYDERTFPLKDGGRKITRRPLIAPPWSLEFDIQVTEDLYDESKIREFFEVAGRRCGCGAYGPTFGRFMIDKWEVQK